MPNCEVVSQEILNTYATKQGGKWGTEIVYAEKTITPGFNTIDPNGKMTPFIRVQEKVLFSADE